MIDHRIDFLVVIVAENCNPNGDPLNGNRPREDMDGYGEISDVCLKRKIRNRLQDMGYPVFMQRAEYSNDRAYSAKERFDECDELKEAAKGEKGKSAYESMKECQDIACRRWLDVRAFGQVFPFKAGEAVTFSVRGPVSISMARSIDVVNIRNIGITKSMPNEEVPKKVKDSSTMGKKSIIDRGVYIARGSILPALAKMTGFDEDDAEAIHESLKTMFENDASAARPSGSMTVSRLYWWEHKNTGYAYSPAAVFRSVKFKLSEEYPFYTVEEESLKGLEPDIYIDQ